MSDTGHSPIECRNHDHDRPMSADGTPDSTPRDTLARVLEPSDQHPGAIVAMRQDAALRGADHILSSPEARAAVIAATPRDELLAALVADGTLREEMPDHSGYGGGLNPALLGKRRLVTEWEPLP